MNEYAIREVLRVPLRASLAWPLLAVTAIVAGTAFSSIRLPAAWLMGPMLASIALASTGVIDVRLPRTVAICAQSIIGCVVAASISPQIVASIVARWIPMLGSVAATVVCATLVGWGLARFGTLPAATVAWGSSPGGAQAMTAMSEDYGADARLVAFMQYVRVIVVVFTASIVTRMIRPAHGVVMTPAASGSFDPIAFAFTIAIALVGTSVALAARLPAGALLGPMILGGVLHASGLVRIWLPVPLLDATYASFGAYVGVQFRLETVRTALRALPQILLATAALVLMCAGAGLLLVRVAHVDVISAYLATSPGGLDSVAIIAVGAGVNVPLVVSLQTLRFVVVIITGPALARFIARTTVSPGTDT